MSPFVTIAILVVIAFVLVKYSQHKSKMSVLDRPHFIIQGNGEFGVEAVGESHYQPALRKIVHGKGYVKEQYTAHLICENDNPHDANAVRVDIVGSTVGYLSRQSALAYRGILAGKELGNATGVVQALIIGGGKEKPHYGVWLDT